MELIEQFFATALERETIRLRREAGEMPWTTDPVFSAWRFCNVRRETDRTTVWFRENVRSKTTGLRALEACVVFRWFNRVEVGERIKDLLIDGWSTPEARRRLRGVRPIVTGAYMIRTPTGLDKLEGVLRCVDVARPRLKGFLKRRELTSLEEATRVVATLPYLGRFLAYEVVSDLRWTDVLDWAGDVDTWASAGPGCARGLGRVVANDPSLFSYGSAAGQQMMLNRMREILELSRENRYWPAAWPRWEMREVEHWSCEFDKIERARSGERLKRRYP